MSLPRRVDELPERFFVYGTFLNGETLRLSLSELFDRAGKHTDQMADTDTAIIQHYDLYHGNYYMGIREDIWRSSTALLNVKHVKYALQARTGIPISYIEVAAPRMLVVDESDESWRLDGFYNEDLTMSRQTSLSRMED